MNTESNDRVSGRRVALIASGVIIALVVGVIGYRITVRRPAQAPVAAPTAEHELLRVGALPVT